jgi:hypothetical protein
MKVVIERFEPVNLLADRIWNPLGPASGGSPLGSQAVVPASPAGGNGAGGCARCPDGSPFPAPVLGRAIGKQYKGTDRLIAPLDLIHEVQLRSLCSTRDGGCHLEGHNAMCDAGFARLDKVGLASHRCNRNFGEGWRALRSGLISCCRPCPAGSGRRSAGGRAPKDGCARSLWPCVAGESPAVASGMSAGCLASERHVASPRSGSNTGATFRHRPPWRIWPAMRIGDMRWSSSMRRLKESWGGISIRGGCGRASTGMR